ncbi:MAG: hypothetical protein WCJ91_07815, partial [Actinomycetes bacterium]
MDLIHVLDRNTEVLAQASTILLYRTWIITHMQGEIEGVERRVAFTGKKTFSGESTNHPSITSRSQERQD